MLLAASWPGPRSAQDRRPRRARSPGVDPPEDPEIRRPDEPLSFHRALHLGRREGRARRRRVVPRRDPRGRQGIVDTQQGAPRRAETTRQAIFTERPMETSDRGGRLVDPDLRAISGPAPRTRPRRWAPGRSKGSDRPRPAQERRTSPGRRPDRGPDPHRIRIRGHLPPGVRPPARRRSCRPRPVRIGDTLADPPAGGPGVARRPDAPGRTLLGQARRDPQGSRRPADGRLDRVSGKAAGPSGDSTVNAEVLFTFSPTEAAPKRLGQPDALTGPPRDQIEARGRSPSSAWPG